MVGQGRPISVVSFAVHSLAAISVAICASWASAAEIDVRLRFAWGSGAQAPQTWHGAISVAGAKLADLQPLGIEADEAAALRLEGDSVVVAPLAPRKFDGCDITVRGDEAALVTVQLKNATAVEAKEIQIPLGQLTGEQFRAPLDELGGFLLVNRAPGDRLRVSLDRDSMVFDPAEAIKLTVTPDLKGEPAGAALTLEVHLRRIEGGPLLWETTQSVNPGAATPIALELPAPATEGAYRLSMKVLRPAGITSKLTPWQHSAPAAARDVEFVVVDPKARLPLLTDKWEAMQTIDPSSSKWWQRVPQWTQLDRLPVVSSPRSLGNVKVVVHAEAPGGFVELPAPAAGAEPNWQGYPLAIRDVGQPHAIEIELPADARQQLAISIIEPDAAGRVQSFGREAGVYIDGGLTTSSGANGGAARHRIVFWPRTATPVLLLANHSPARAAQYGTIRVWRRPTEAAPVAAIAATGAAVAPGAASAPPEPVQPPASRLVAAYVSLPHLVDSLGAAEELDAASGLSVDGWGTFLDAGQRLAQELRADGFNAAVVCIAADGGSLAAIDALGSSPRHDTALLSVAGADPVRKDVLEALLRIFDREGLRLIPAIELAAPLPALEALRRSGDPRETGVECVAFDGHTWGEQHPGEAKGAHYNVLNPQVQAAVGDVIDQLVARYGAHSSMAGVAVQLSGRGYAVLPGMAWGMDDATTQRFADDAQIELNAEGPDRFQRRADTLASAAIRPRWVAWRQSQLTRFYSDLAMRVAQSHADRQLVVCTEQLFDGAEATQRLRQAVSGRASLDDATAELGVDLDALAAAPGVCLLRPRRLASDEALRSRALDLAINGSPELDQAVATHPQAGELLFNASRRLRLASFDAQSPFGADKTYLSMSVASFPTGAAARRPMATAFASRDFFTLVEGAEALPLVQDDAATHARRLFQQLPGAEAEVRVERRQPATMRVYRAAGATTVCIVNDSPWPVEVALPIDSTEPAAWHELGVDAGAEGAAGQLAGPEPWRVTLPAYGIAARRYDTRSLRVGQLAPKSGGEASAALGARIAEIEQRLRGLDIERPYPQLQNPDFEIAGAGGAMSGWRPRMGKAGLVAIDATAVESGERALHLRSEDRLGVAAQSNLFAIPPTGQLTVRARMRVADMAPEARVYAWIEFKLGGVTKNKPLGEARVGADWTECEFVVDDLPLGDAGQMRLMFHLAGSGEAWVDGVQLFDLRFDKSKRTELATMLYAAKTARDEGKLVDCQRKLDGYWPRYLLEYLPATTIKAIEQPPQTNIAERPDDGTAPAPAPAAGESRGIGERVRDALPRFHR